MRGRLRFLILIGLTCSISALVGYAGMQAALASSCPDTTECPANGICHVLGHPNANGRGVHVSTGMLVLHATKFVEIGWYSDPPGGAETLCDKTPSDGTPWVLVYGFYNANTIKCKKSPPSLASDIGLYITFKVHDNNQDGVWDYSYNGGVSLGSFDMGDLLSGDPRNNGERHNTDNSAKAEFKGLQLMNSSQAWINWSGTTLAEDTDSGFQFCGPGVTGYSDTHTAVKTTC